MTRVSSLEKQKRSWLIQYWIRGRSSKTPKSFKLPYGNTLKTGQLLPGQSISLACKWCSRRGSFPITWTIDTTKWCCSVWPFLLSRRKPFLIIENLKPSSNHSYGETCFPLIFILCCNRSYFVPPTLMFHFSTWFPMLDYSSNKKCLTWLRKVCHLCQ